MADVLACGRLGQQYFMYAYVINLDRSPDRRAHMIAELKKTGLDYEFVSACDGRDLDVNDPSVVTPELFTKSPFPANHAATTLSHIRCYERMIAHGRDTALVLEDDVLLPADVDALTDAVAADLTGSEVALLSFTNPAPMKMAREGAVPLPHGRTLVRPVDPRQLASGGAYVITREACERMIKSLVPVRACADEWGYFYHEGFLDRVRCVVPSTVSGASQFHSMQGSYTLGSGLKSRLLWPLVKLRLPVVQQILMYRRRRIGDRHRRHEMIGTAAKE
jgi:glycosyl transferase family 25